MMTAMQTIIACPKCGHHCHKKGVGLLRHGCPIHGHGHICQCGFCEGRGTVKATFRDDLGW
jgi:hypothetical protein